MISGLDPQKYSAEANAILFLGISSYTGSERGMQDDSGNMMSQSLGLPDPKYLNFYLSPSHLADTMLGFQCTSATLAHVGST